MLLLSFSLQNPNSQDDTFSKIYEYLMKHSLNAHSLELWQSLDNMRNSSQSMLQEGEQLAPSSKCSERLLKDIAIVDIYYGTQSAIKYQRDITATFMTQLASIGR